MIEKRYYACLEFSDGKIEKKVFLSRDDARKYISEHRNDKDVTKSWTE